MNYGKFNSAEELLKGYTELEKSFTQKCQQLANLQKQSDGTSEQTPPSPIESKVATIPQNDAVLSNPNSTPTNEQLQQYLLEHPDFAQTLLQTNAQGVTPPPTVMSGGGTVSMALPTKPQSIREATIMAKTLFGK